MNLVFRRVGIKSLVFDHSNIDRLEAGAFLHLLPVSNLEFHSTNISYLYSEFYSDVRICCLISLILHWFPDNLNADLDFLDSRTSVYFNLLSIRCQSSIFQTLRKLKLSRLKCLRSMFLTESGIEVIEDDAFDDLSTSLELLDLSRNRIKHVQSSVFIILLTKHTFIRLDVNENPIECDCEFYSLQSVSIWTDQFKHNHFSLSISCNKPIQEQGFDASAPTCHNLDVIHLNRFCLAKHSFLLYPKFRLKLIMMENLSKLDIKSSNKHQFRVLIVDFTHIHQYNLKWGIANRRCPTNGFIEKFVKCLQLEGGANQLPITSDMLGHVCVTHSLRKLKRFWPFHCITIDSMLRRRASGEIRYHPVIGIAVSVGTIMAFVIVIVAWKSWKNEKKLSGLDKSLEYRKNSVFDDCNEYYETI